MSDTESRNVGRDVGGIALFGLAVFAAISVVMSLLQPVENPGGTTAFVGLLVGAIGPLPGLALSAGLAWMGARLWLFGRGEAIGRNLAGLVGATAGLCVLAGAISPEAGGALGGMTGAAVSGFLTAFVGVPFGLACLLVPVWFIWVRPHDVISWNLGQEVASAAAPHTQAEGVSAAEAEALLPRVEAPIEEAPPAPPPSPYPPDVRLQGQVPDGTRPLGTHDEPRSPAIEGPPADEPLPLQADDRTPEPAAERAREDLAEVFPPAVPFPATEAHPALDAEAGLVEPLVTPQASAEPLEPGTLPSPSWEQSGLYTEEPVDAYGTPLSVLESHLGPEGVGAVVDPPDLEGEEDPEEEVPLAEAAAAASEAEVEDTEEKEEKDEEGDEVYAEDEDEDEVEEEEEEEEEEGEEEGEYAEDEEEDEEEEEGEEEEEEEEYEEEGDEVYAEDEDEEEEEEYEDEEEDDAEEEEEESKEVSEPQVVLEPALAAAGTPEAPESPPTDPEAVFPGPELVLAAGALFLERGRVAVSMLQREFDLDFKQATLILDQLQEQGLIGPYLGGQKRDILLTLEEWQAKAGAV